MESLPQPAAATTPPGSPTQPKVPFQILQTTQTRKLQATQLRKRLTSFTHARIKLGAQTGAFAGRIGLGINQNAEHEALLNECHSALGSAALAAVAPGGFRGALGGYANVQRIATAISSASDALSRYITNRSTSPSAPSSSISEPAPKETLDDQAPVHQQTDQNPQPRTTDSHSEASAECGTESEDHIEQFPQPHLAIDGPSGLLTKPQLWHPRDRKASIMRYGPGHARATSLPTQIKQDPDTDTRAGARASLPSIGSSSTLESPFVLAVERDNYKLKRARNSAEDGDSDDEERQRPRVKVKLENLDNIFGKSMSVRKRNQGPATALTSSIRWENRNETPDPHMAYDLSSEGSSSAPSGLNTLPSMSASTPAQLPSPTSLAVERKQLKRARNSVGNDDDDDEARKPSRRMKFEEAASTSANGTTTRMQAQTQARASSSFSRRRAHSQSIADRLRRDSFGAISPEFPMAAAVSAPPVVVPVRRSARLQAKQRRIRVCVVCPEALNCHTHIS